MPDKVKDDVHWVDKGKLAYGIAALRPKRHCPVSLRPVAGREAVPEYPDRARREYNAFDKRTHHHRNPTLDPPRFGMTSANTSSKTPEAPARFRLPDPPQREPDEMTQYDTLFKQGDSHALAVHLGNPERTLVEADRWIVAGPEDNRARARRPDLLVAFGVDPAIYRENNGYVVLEQGKAPDFVLEVASESTGETDVVAKREEYAALGIGEYWRFDETGEHHRTKLAGDRLVEGRYEPIEIQELPGGVLQGYSRALNLHLRWEEGRLVFRDPATGDPIATLESERNRAEAAEARAEAAEARADTAEARADTEREERLQERQAREAAEARNRELEEELRRLRGN